MEENIQEAEGMTPPQISLSTDSIKEIGDAGDAGVQNIDKALTLLTHLNSDRVMHEPTCIVCSSANRSDAERKWVETKNYDEVKTFFKSRTGIDLSVDEINYHMNHHMDRGVKEYTKLAYIDELKRLNSVELSTLDRIKICLSALTERLVNINSLLPNKDSSEADIEKIKSAETVKITQATEKFIKLQATIRGEMKDNGELIILPYHAFIEVFHQIILEVKSEEAKNAIAQVLNKLRSLSKLTQ